MNNVSVAAEIVEVKPVPPPANTAARYVLASVVPLGALVLVGVGVCVLDAVMDGVGVCVLVLVGVFVVVGVILGVLLGVDVFEGVCVGVILGVLLGVDVFEGVTVEVFVGVGVLVVVGVTVGVGDGRGQLPKTVTDRKLHAPA